LPLICQTRVRWRTLFAIISKIRLGVLSLKYVWECCPFLIELLAQPLPSGDIPVTEIADPESGEFLQEISNRQSMEVERGEDL